MHIRGSFQPRARTHVSRIAGRFFTIWGIREAQVKQSGWQYTAVTYAFPNVEQSVVPCLVPTVASCPACRFLRRQVKWSVIPLSQNFPKFVVIHTVQGFSVVNEAEVDVLLEFPCFFYDPMDVGDLVSGSPAFSKSSLYFWKFLVQILLKLTWRFLRTALLAYEMCAIVR